MQSWAQLEMAGAAVWDGRCRRSLVEICERRLTRPLVSFSKACGEAKRQAAHRIFQHANTTVDGLLRGHFAQTEARCRAARQDAPAEPILVVQDTTMFKYTTHLATEGLGPINTSGQGRGLFAHAALAVTPSGVPLGFLHLSLWARDPAEHGKRREAYTQAKTATALKESQKWINAVWGTEACLPPEVPVVVIGDREADFYDLFAAARRPQTQLLVRAYHPRQMRVTQADGSPGAASNVHAQLAQATAWGEREVAVPRKPGQRARVARVALRVLDLWLQPTAGLPRDDAALREGRLYRVRVVEAREIAAPEGAEPLHWILITTLEVPDCAAACLVLDYYARRWLIEEVHLVLKSGFRAERLQFDDAHSLQNALALLYVVAWRVVFSRDLTRLFPDLAAEALVDATELAVLEAAEARPLRTARDALRAIAHLAGFPRYPSAGEPGVRTLWEGFLRLEAAVLGWRLARGEQQL